MGTAAFLVVTREFRPLLSNKVAKYLDKSSQIQNTRSFVVLLDGKNTPDIWPGNNAASEHTEESIIRVN
jgi:hypothetical protein